MQGCEFRFGCAYLLYYKCQKINLNHSESYKGSSDWIKNKKATSPINKNDNNKHCNSYIK